MLPEYRLRKEAPDNYRGKMRNTTVLDWESICSIGNYVASFFEQYCIEINVHIFMCKFGKANVTNR